MRRAVLDTNILVSALLSACGQEFRLLELARAGGLVPCVSSAILNEYLEVLSRGKFAFGSARLHPVFDFLHASAIHVEPGEVGFASPDPSDTKFIACAVAAGADFIVTGNRRHFPEARYGTAAVVSARELLGRLTG